MGTVMIRKSVHNIFFIFPILTTVRMVRPQWLIMLSEIPWYEIISKDWSMQSNCDRLNCKKIILSLKWSAGLDQILLLDWRTIWKSLICSIKKVIIGKVLKCLHIRYLDLLIVSITGKQFNFKKGSKCRTDPTKHFAFWPFFFFMSHSVFV